MAPWRVVLVLVGLPGLIVTALLLSVAEPVRRVNDGGGTRRRVLPLAEVLRELRARAGLLVPLYLGNAFLAVGDYSLLGWSPTFLARDFTLRQL